MNAQAMEGLMAVISEYGVLFVWLVAAITIGVKLGQTRLGPSKLCRFCCEKIRLEAVVCKYCGRDVGSPGTGS